MCVEVCVIGCVSDTVSACVRVRVSEQKCEVCVCDDDSDDDRVVSLDSA